MSGTEYENPNDVNVDDTAMEEEAASIGEEVEKLPLEALSIEEHSTITARAHSDETFLAAQALTDLFMATIKQDAQNIISVVDEYNKLDQQLQNELQALTMT